MLLSHIHSLCTFTNKVINVNIAIKCGKKEKKIIAMMWTTVNMLGKLFTWFVHTYKYGK